MDRSGVVGEEPSKKSKRKTHSDETSADSTSSKNVGRRKVQKMTPPPPPPPPTPVLPTNPLPPPPPPTTASAPEVTIATSEYYAPAAGNGVQPYFSSCAGHHHQPAPVQNGFPTPSPSSSLAQQQQQPPPPSSSSSQVAPPIPHFYEVAGNVAKDFGRADVMILGIANCVARKVRPESFLGRVSVAFPYADPFKDRVEGPYPNLTAKEGRPVLGTLEVRRPPPEMAWGPQFGILNSQYRMGHFETDYYNRGRLTDQDYLTKSTMEDTYAHRLLYFKSSLLALKKYLLTPEGSEVKTLVFPERIGCGSARGKWEEDYKPNIMAFANNINRSRLINVYIVKPKKM